jgi:hypothetical protein
MSDSYVGHTLVVLVPTGVEMNTLLCSAVPLIHNADPAELEKIKARLIKVFAEIQEVQTQHPQALVAVQIGVMPDVVFDKMNEDFTRQKKPRHLQPV